MAQNKITKRVVDAIEKAERDQFIWDDELRGFGLKITPAGKKVYIVQYRTGGRGSPTRRYTIGAHDPWTPAKAREEAERILTKVRQGIDPNEEKAERNRLAIDLAFDAYADRFLKDYVQHEWAASYAFAEGILRLHVKPVLKTKPLPSIKRADVTNVFDRLPAGKIALRRNVFAVIHRLFRWAVGRGDLERSPLEGMETPPTAKDRDRVLSDAELRLVWGAAAQLGYPFGPLYHLLILTGQRREEAAGLNWKELHRAAAQWKLPGERAKNGEPHMIHLPASAIAILDQLAKGDKWPRRGLVFTTTGETAVSGHSRGKSRLDAQMLKDAKEEAKRAGEEPEKVEIEPWRVHDLRRTVATGMQRLGIRFEVVEAALNHKSGISRTGVAKVYQRHSWEPEKCAAWDAWSAHVDAVITGVDHTNVVPLATARA